MAFQQKRSGKILFSLAIILCVLCGIAFTSIALIEKFKPQIIAGNYIKDDFAIACLKTPVEWNGYEWLIGILFLLLSVFFTARIFSSGKVSSVYGLLATSLAAIWLLTLTIIPKIEPYSQGPAIEFWQKLKNEDCYVETIGFKSYAYLFYTEKKPSQNTPKLLEFVKKNEKIMEEQGFPVSTSFSLACMNWFLDGAIDKPAYFVAKVSEADRIHKDNDSLKELYRKGGFVFYRREPTPVPRRP